MRRCLTRGIKPNSIIDVGASNGCWSEKASPLFPNSRYLCIEAQEKHREALSQFAANHRNIEFLIAAAGATPGEIFFRNAENPFGGVATYEQTVNSVSLPVTSIDREVAQRQLQPPYLIKLDTHGFEVPILEGATETLSKTQALIIEVYNFRISPEALLFHEMCGHLAGRGFRCIDLFEPLFRPRDEAFWQMDMIFVPANRPEFDNLRYA